MRYRFYYIIVLIFSFEWNSYSQGINERAIKINFLENQIDSIITASILEKAFPGCVLLASTKDSLLFFGSYGFQTYDSLRPITNDAIFDLASLTKVLGGTLAMMKLYEDSLILLDAPIRNYVPKVGKKVGKVTVRQALAHQGGLYPWIQYYNEIKKKDGRFKKKHISSSPTDAYPFQLSDNMYLHKDFYNHIKKRIRRSKVESSPSYKYSGLFFYLIPEIVERLAAMPFDQYLNEKFYQPMKLETMGFNPIDRIELENLVPTEIDSFFRMKSIHGVVHDEGAIMMRGVSGNAGLFSDARDIEKILRMLLDNGKYDSMQIFKPQTIQVFTTTQYPNQGNRRGLGFDKPLLEYNEEKSSVAKSASFKSFGHTGYTGTLMWADPEGDLIYIFLSNRVYPTRKNQKIYELNVRPFIHQLFYNTLNNQDAKSCD